MKKLVLIGLLMCALIFSFRVKMVEARDIWVPYDYPTIQAAIDAANPGDRIHIDGTRYENVTVYKPLSPNWRDWRHSVQVWR